jgi:hypothetical protein
MRALPCVNFVNKLFSLFVLTILPFELYVHKHHVFLVSSSSKNQKAVEFLKRRCLKKGWTIPHEKLHFLLNMDYLLKGCQTLPKISYEESNDSYLPSDVMDI